MNKNIIIGIFVLFVVGLGYYSFYSKERNTSPKETTRVTVKSSEKNYFAQNQDCLRYKDEITKKLETKESSFGEASLEQIFYGPKQGSCLYVEYTEKVGFYNKRLFDILNDGPSAKPLEMCSSFYPSEKMMENWKKADGNLTLYYKTLKSCDNFDEKVEGYKQ